ncbi:class I SAM-dependent methyltransferase [Snodgrassella sp. CFCC 13594]|uniref:class I SAM-dependent methyltransferase n=1 Tax=Snodgrassella sp. CFCC 13594 TaxID=1775559 RepID=UPI000834EE96|nr:SAM-dependent methyltransferase [Snodgrassella sp. CFCC 13594]
MSQTTLPNADDWFIHAHLATTMDERLLAVKAQPQHIILAGADANHSYGCLNARYPQAAFHEYDSRKTQLQAALSLRKQSRSLWQKIGTKLPPQTASDALPNQETADMVWGNLALLHQPEPSAVFDNWAHALKPDGLLFFTHVGPDTLKEIQALWQAQGIAVTTPLFIDMHDLGDMLFHHGFYDPVMDMSRLTLQYTQPQRFICDMQVAGIWQSLHFHDEQAAIRALEKAWADGSVHDVTLELVYGHGIKKTVLPVNQALVQFYPHRPTPLKTNTSD